MSLYTLVKWRAWLEDFGSGREGRPASCARRSKYSEDLKRVVATMTTSASMTSRAVKELRSDIVLRTTVFKEPLALNFSTSLGHWRSN